MISDQVGSPVLIVNASTGAVAEQISYDAWGNVTSDSNPGFRPFGFAGGLYDSDAGLVHFGAREYDPQTGRWISKDPILFGGGNLDLYGYVLNDPINLTDRSGLVLEDDSLTQLGKFLEANPDVAALVARASPYLASFAVGFGIGEAINYACGGECFPGLAVWIYNEMRISLHAGH